MDHDLLLVITRVTRRMPHVVLFSGVLGGWASVFCVVICHIVLFLLAIALSVLLRFTVSSNFYFVAFFSDYHGNCRKRRDEETVNPSGAPEYSIRYLYGMH
jgi:hypothetical protein